MRLSNTGSPCDSDQETGQRHCLGQRDVGYKSMEQRTDICIVCSNAPGTNDEIGRPENETLLANDGEEGERNKLL